MTEKNTDFHYIFAETCFTMQKRMIGEDLELLDHLFKVFIDILQVSVKDK